MESNIIKYVKSNYTEDFILSIKKFCIGEYDINGIYTKLFYQKFKYEFFQHICDDEMTLNFQKTQTTFICATQPEFLYQMFQFFLFEYSCLYNQKSMV